VGTWGRQPMRRAILLAVLCAAVAVSVLAIRATDRDRPGSAGAAATPATASAPARQPADRRCRQMPLPAPPARLALVGSRLLIASREARSVGAAEVRACRWLGTIAVLPSHAKVTPPPPQAGVINGPDRPYALAADHHSLWVVGELTLYRYDLASGRLTARVPLPGHSSRCRRGLGGQPQPGDPAPHRSTQRTGGTPNRAGIGAARGSLRVGLCLGRAGWGGWPRSGWRRRSAG
jgi:hypothetical protein